MASEEDRISARRRIEIHRENLRQLEERAATYAGDVPLHIVNQIAQERANIAILEPIATAGPSAQVQQFVTQVSRSNGGDMAMLMSQFALLNARMTTQEERTQHIIDEQSRASVWRMSAGQDIEALKQDTESGEWGRARNFRLLLSSIALSALALGAVLVLVLR